MNETECLSDLRLDELLVGESVPAAAHAHLASCADCRARRGELAADRAQFLAAPPPLPRPLARAARPRSRWIAGAGMAAGMAAAATLALVVAVPERERAIEPAARRAADPGETRTKGSAWLRLIVEHRGAQRAADPGAQVHPGDTLIYSISTPRPTYLAVLGRDARGQVTAYFPASEAAARVEAGPDQVLPLATVLDEALGAEQVIAAFCEHPAPMAELIAGLPAPPSGCKLDVFEIEKVR